MPIYEYRCKKCGRVMEVLESAGGRARHKCSHCGSYNMEKLFSAFSVGGGGASSVSSGSCPTGTCPLS